MNAITATLTPTQQQLVSEHLDLVEKVIRKYISLKDDKRDMEWGDLYQTGCLALCHAALKYDMSKPFAAYACRSIRNSLAKLHICPVKDSFFLRLFTCIRLHTEGKLPIADFQKHLKKPENSKLEKLILKMSQELSFTVAELLDHVETTQTDERNSWELPEVASELPIINPVQMPILQAVGNLYLQKQILFFT